MANIGIVCRDPSLFPLVAQQLTPEVRIISYSLPKRIESPCPCQAVKKYMGHLLKGKVIRYVMPGISALNFVCTSALDSGTPILSSPLYLHGVMQWESAESKSGARKP